VARAHRWLELIERGDFPNVPALARAVGVDPSYVHRHLRLTLLRPEYLADLLDGRSPESMSIEKLRRIPEVWEEQAGLWRAE
jgi:hypothetical protein